MKFIRPILLFIFAFLICDTLFSQATAYFDNFNDNSKSGGWEPSNMYTTTETGGAFKITGKGNFNLSGSFVLNTGTLNLTSHPYVSLKIKTDTSFTLRIGLASSSSNNTAYVDYYVRKTTSFDTLIFDFTNNFGTNTASAITQIKFLFNPNASFTGTVYFDDLAAGDSALVPVSPCKGTSIKTDTVYMTLAADSIAVLEASPYTASYVHGSFIDGKGVLYDSVGFHYRGAYTLLGMLYSGPQRLWKMKFTKAKPYNALREWDFNYDMSARHKFAYDVMARAGVKAPSARHVIMFVNGVRHGIHLEFEDPDNKPLLLRLYGDDSGDLYKAGTDLPIPNSTSYPGGLCFMGNRDSNYYFHYNKKTNNNDVPLDFSSIRKFLTMITFVPNDQFVDSLNAHFDVPSFIRYMVASNFMSHWDGYPQRAKNFWIYYSIKNDKWYFIPWDMEGTFELNYNPGSCTAMGPATSIFFQLDKFDPACNDYKELEKTLTLRMMMYAQFRNAYVLEYNKALTTYLNTDSLNKQLDSLTNQMACTCNNGEYQKYKSSIEGIRTFIDYKTGVVEKELKTLTLWDTVPVTAYIPPDTTTHDSTHLSTVVSNDFIITGMAPNPFAKDITLSFFMPDQEELIFILINATGTVLYTEKKIFTRGMHDHNFTFDVSPGIYYLQIKNSRTSVVRMVIRQ